MPSGWRQTRPGTPASLYIHVPYCRRMCWYCGCNTSVTLRDEPVAAYAELLNTEIDLVGRHLGKRLPIVHLHFGGGTPTIMAADLFRAVMDAAARNLRYHSPKPSLPSRSTRAR